MTSQLSRATLVCFACVCVLGLSAPARAQGFISPFVGFNYGGDAACPTIRDCGDKSSNLGVSFGVMNAIIGFEEEFGYARNFFDDPTVSESSILTLMSNLIIGPRLTFIRPYVSGGIGLMKTHVEFEPDSILSLNNNDVGWNFGGGVILQAPHIGIRGDVRTFHGFDDLSVFGFDVSDLDLSYGRVTAGVFFSF